MTKSTITKEPITHDLKIYPEFFSAVCTGVKRAELRKNDRDYRVGDTLHLMETPRGSCHQTGEFINVKITHIADVGEWMPGFVMLSIELQERRKADKPPVHPTVASEELDDETLQELIEFRRTTFEYHSKEGNKVQTIIHGVTLSALRELQERRKADSEPVVQPVMFIDGDISPDDAEKLMATIRELNGRPSEPVGAPDAWLWKKSTGYLTAGISRPMYEPQHSAAIPLYAIPQQLTDAERAELQERRKFDQAKLINKFYERYPLDTFNSDSERAEALGYYMAGAELQRCGEFIKYEDLCGDE